LHGPDEILLKISRGEEIFVNISASALFALDHCLLSLSRPVPFIVSIDRRTDYASYLLAGVIDV
jgi:hypothetical protein